MRCAGSLFGRKRSLFGPAGFPVADPGKFLQAINKKE